MGSRGRVRPRLGGSPPLSFIQGKCGVTMWCHMVARQGDLPSAPSTWVLPLLIFLFLVNIQSIRYFQMRRIEWGLATPILSLTSEKLS